MFEAVGEAFWPVYFEQLRDRLRPGGTAGLQVITIRDESFKVYRRELDFIRDAHIAQSLDFPSVNVRIDRERAGLLGVEVEDIARSLVAATTSSRFTVANFWADPKSGVSYNLQVQIPEDRTQSIEDLGNTPITSTHGEPVALRSVIETIYRRTS